VKPRSDSLREPLCKRAMPFTRCLCPIVMSSCVKEHFSDGVTTKAQRKWCYDWRAQSVLIIAARRCLDIHCVLTNTISHERNSRRDSTAFGRTRSQPSESENRLGDSSTVRKFLEANGTRISIPDDRNFGTEGEPIESGLRRTVEGRDTVMRSLIRAIYRFRDATLVSEKKDDFGNALQNLYRELERAEDLVGPG
jgi:hypothetical protein